MTFTLATVSLCLTLFVGAYAGVKERIVGGTTAKINEFPYQVSVRKYGQHFCSGSIISERHILTAGHCVKTMLVPPYDDIIIVSGSSISSGQTSGDTHFVKSVDLHPEYGISGTASVNDVAIITLKENIKFNDNQRKIDLPTAEPQEGAKAIISGWGLENYPGTLPSLDLLKADMTIISGSACRASIPPKLSVNDKQVCALQKKGVGACSGDSGGPLSANNQVIGVASWVVFPCGAGYPDVYSSVFAYKDWIKKVIAKS